MNTQANRETMNPASENGGASSGGGRARGSTGGGFAGFGGGGDDKESLYDMLGITDKKFDPDTEEGARALKKAKNVYRRAHPDKHRDDPNAQKNFLDLQRAYEILADPGKRAAYDNGGRMGVKMYETGGIGGMVPEEVLLCAMKVFSTVVMPAIVCALCGVMFCLCPTIILAVLLASLKADGVGSLAQSTWGAVLTPLWILDAGLIVGALVSLCAGSICGITAIKQCVKRKDFDDMSSQEKVQFSACSISNAIGSLLRSVQLILLFVLQILIAVRLDGGIESATWLGILTPWIIIEALEIVRVPFQPGLCNVCPYRQTFEMTYLGVENPLRHPCLYLMWIRFVYSPVLRLVLAILVGLKLDLALPSSTGWGTVLLPLWLWIGFAVLFSAVSCFEDLCVKCFCRKPEEEEEVKDATHEDDDFEDLSKQPRSRACGGDVLKTICCTLPALVWAILLVVKLDSPSDMTWTVVWIPYFVMVRRRSSCVCVVCVVCVCVCVCVCARARCSLAPLTRPFAHILSHATTHTHTHTQTGIATLLLCCVTCVVGVVACGIGIMSKGMDEGFPGEDGGGFGGGGGDGGGAEADGGAAEPMAADDIETGAIPASEAKVVVEASAIPATHSVAVEEQAVDDCD